MHLHVSQYGILCVVKPLKIYTTKNNSKKRGSKLNRIIDNRCKNTFFFCKISWRDYEQENSLALKTITLIGTYPY